VANVDSLTALSKQTPVLPSERRMLFLLQYWANSFDVYWQQCRLVKPVRVVVAA
jgi:hypothetical protein